MSDSGSPFERHPWRTVAALTAVALVARVISLDSGLWIDEIISMVDSFRPPLVQVLTVYPGDTQHPLYSVFANVTVSLFGDSAWAARVPALLFGVASVPVLYALGERVTERREALLACAVLAVSYHHVWFSQNARGYTMLAFWTILSTLYLHRGLEEGRRGDFVGYGVAIGLGVYTHLTMVFTVAAQLLVALWWTVLRRKRAPEEGSAVDALLGLSVGVVVGAALYAPIFMQVVDFFLNQPSRLEGVSTPAWALAEALRVLQVGAGALAGLLVGGTLFVAGLLSFWMRDRLFVLLACMPGAVTLVGALVARGTMYPRFYFHLIGFAFLIVMRGAFVSSRVVADQLGPSWQPRAPVAATAIGLLMVAVSISSLRLNYTVAKQDYGAALEYVESVAGPDDVIATVGVPAAIAYGEYFERAFPDVTDVDSFEDLEGAEGRLWLLYTFERYIEAGDPALMERIRGACEIDTFIPATVGGGHINVCAAG